MLKDRMKIRNRKKICKYSKSILHSKKRLFTKRLEIYLLNDLPRYLRKVKNTNFYVLKSKKYFGIFSIFGSNIFIYNNYNINKSIIKN